MANLALIIAGGRGNRMGQDLPKQFLSVEDKPIIAYTLEAFQNHPEIDGIGVVCIPGWETVMEAYANQFNITKLVGICAGGANGNESIGNGLDMLESKFSDKDLVFVHDAVRPMVSEEVISDCIHVTQEKGNAITIIPTAEALLGTTDQETSLSVIDRSTTKRTQTPQGFVIGDLQKMHKEAAQRGITDPVASCTLAIELGIPVNFSQGSEKNIKLTTVEDIDIFKALLHAKRSEWLKSSR
ncbi:MAG: 2-C-methyl-D-erythritol 4-phosphate cytidylyltransferase [Bifidobacteriaceae bacterium]|jgi:2-C-methyl-D-erythritol 4-phosphate cytidylyltransferase|nr:2-C-methyl-D-erythritol 4-phosphate cytidylyltransferase [Bifidobacteriaceae bacterium]MCI1915208.1 2-C-methyl-D-erythritol 4-phosphate cytidylyltransferase [Bifidobacteriaceae bacterium]